MNSLHKNKAPECSNRELERRARSPSPSQKNQGKMMCFSNVPHHFLARFCPPLLFPSCSKGIQPRHIDTFSLACYKGETSDFGRGSFPVKGTMTYKPKDSAFFMNLSWLSRGSISAALRCSRFPWSLATKGEHPAELNNFL